MRQRLLKQLPELTQFYGLKPTDIPEMTYAEVGEYVVQMEQEKARQRREA